MSKSWTPGHDSETERAAARRLAEGWYDKYLTGNGLDIGCGKSTVVPNARAWDIANGDGDATLLVGVEDNSLDFVYASHVLEHLDNPRLALLNWWRVLTEGGFLLIAVPDEDSFEKGIWPSLNNTDHKTTWTVLKQHSWSEVSHSLARDLASLPGAKVHEIRLVQDRPEWSSIEAVVEKARQPKLTPSMVACAVCMCGSRDLIFRGTNLARNMVFYCTQCGQTTHYNLDTHTKLADENIAKIRQHMKDNA